MKVLSLAIRNLLRNRRRSLATLLALAIGASAILIFGGYTTNVRLSMLTAYVRSGGHLQIQHKDFFYYGSGNPASYGIRNYDKIIAAIQSDPALAGMTNAVSPLLQFGGIAGNFEASVSRTILGTGYVPTDVNRMRLWNEYELRDKKPYFVLEGAGPESAIVGIGVARVLLLCDSLKVPVEDCPRPTIEPKLQVASEALPSDIANLAAAEASGQAPTSTAGGPNIELLSGNGRSAPNVASLKVLAAESQSFKELDELAVILPLRQAQNLVYGRSDARATAIMVQLKNSHRVPDARARLEALLKKVAPDSNLAVLDFLELNPFYVQTLQLFDTIFGFIFALIGGIVLFTVGNTMNAAVVERTVEIGTLRAVGLRRAGIRQMFVMEGFVLGCVGAISGVLFALGFAAAFNSAQLTWIPPGTSERVPLSLIVHSQSQMIIGITLALIVIAVASAWWPAYRAAQLRIVDALRHA